MKPFFIMKKFFLYLFFSALFSASLLQAQTKVSGIVVDKTNQPIPYANVVFKNSNTGIVTNEDGRFYIESDKDYTTLVVTSAGFSDKEVTLEKAVNYNFKIVLKEMQELNEVVIFTGKTSKKNNPALDILRKIWERKRKNGLYQFSQYQMEKYEKVEFDMNTIDSALMKNKIFKGMEFIFNQVDTSKITGKTYLPIFINEALYDVYGDNTIKKIKEINKANKTSGFNGNQQILAFIKDLYANYDIYDNHLTFFDKSFTSPLSKTGIDVYNYILKDSAFIDNKWCFNIVFYPRRKNELTFKGDFWVNDTTFAIKKINMAVTKSANINWVKDIYIEQEFDVMNDSIFLLTKDYLMSDFALNKKEKSKGVYGKRTSYYRNHEFNKPKEAKFYKEEVNFIDNEVYNRPETYWDENRFEKLSKDEKGIYKMLDTLQTVKKFKQLYSLVSILGSGYVEFDNFDFGSVYSTFGFNDVEGIRLRLGGRTYFGPNDTWRLQGFTAYGFDDNKFKYGASGKWMLDKKNRIIISGGNRRDVEQIGASLTTTNDVLGRSFASSALFTTGNNGKLTNINLTNISFEIEPIKNWTFQAGLSHRTLVSASPTFSLDYYTTLPSAANPLGVIKSEVKQSEANLQIEYTPNRQTIGFGVERDIVDNPYSRIFINFSHGFKGVLNSDFKYDKIQLYYKQPFIIGPLGRTNLILEAGKTFGTIPLGLMSVIPGNQTYFSIENTFNNLNFYEFISDQYLTLQWNHNFQGRLFARIPFMRKLNWREVVGIKGVYGTISDANRAINASGIPYLAPENIYWEYSAGIGNIFKVFRIDFGWRGNYRDLPDAQNFTVKGTFGFNF
ncbi:CarboxypepD_reg-like domain-containing protein [Flavobacterium succinicans]|uniref:CarboxypepD_reg-like domain-containing protein n=2 Tax=Flavobacterium succinicans TaxID=29536 RepID=A0A1I4VUC0_9FLAO|nr:CarboxypepD_reg-like domain-containing protein [Flavobacterium succinicans]